MKGLRSTEVPCQEWNSHHVQFWMAPSSQKVSHSGDVMAGPRRNISMISSWNPQPPPCLIVQVPHFLAPEREERPPFSLQRPCNFSHRKIVCSFKRNSHPCQEKYWKVKGDPRENNCASEYHIPPCFVNSPNTLWADAWAKRCVHLPRGKWIFWTALIVN